MANANLSWAQQLNKETPKTDVLDASKTTEHIAEQNILEDEKTTKEQASSIFTGLDAVPLSSPEKEEVEYIENLLPKAESAKPKDSVPEDIQFIDPEQLNSPQLKEQKTDQETDDLKNTKAVIDQEYPFPANADFSAEEEKKSLENAANRPLDKHVEEEIIMAEDTIQNRPEETEPEVSGEDVALREPELISEDLNLQFVQQTEGEEQNTSLEDSLGQEDLGLQFAQQDKTEKTKNQDIDSVIEKTEAMEQGKEGKGEQEEQKKEENAKHPKRLAGNVPHNYDLLAQIAAEDEVTGPVEEPRQISLSMITKFMKMMFHFDSYKKGHPVLFEKLLLSWRAVVIMLLCCGSASLIFMIYMTFSFPTFVRNYLRSTGITVNSVKVEKFSATNVFIKDISGPHNCFKIQMITLNYTLTDLLRGHIKNAKIEGVQINAKITQDYWGMGAIYQFYQKTLDPKIMQIDHLTLADGKIFIDYGGENIIPLTFSMDNTYQSNLIKSEISFKNDANTIVETNGLLTVSGRGEMQWNLDLKQLKTLDRTNIQDISGTVQALSEGLNFKKVQSALTFRKLYSLLDTRLIVNILNNQFTGSFDLAKTDIAEDNKKTTRLYQVQFADLSISKDGKKISTDNPLVLTAKNLSYPHLKIDQIRLSLTGNLSCENSICSYTLNAPAKGNINGLTALFNGHNYISKKTVDFTFDADNKTPFATVSPESIDATFNIKNLAFNGFRNAEISPVTMNMNNIDVVVSTGRKNTAITGNSQLKIAQGFLQTPDYILKDIQANLTDPFSSLPFGKIKIDEVNLLAKDAFLKVPFHLTMDLEKTQGHAKISALDDKIQFKFQGKIDLPTGSFKGSIAMDPVNLETLGKPLDEIYPSFPKGLKDYTGTLTLQGTIDYKNANLIYGPFVLAVENVGATYQNYRFSGLTTYLNVISLMPFATQPDQEIFIADFASPLPAKNIQALFHIDNSYVFMNKLSLKVGQIPLEMDTLVIPMENSNAILYLQNDNVDLQEINDTFVLPYKINMTGFAQVNLPIFLRENGISLQKGQIKLPNVLLSVPKGKRPAFFTDAATFRISNGTIDINSIPDSDKMKIQLQLSDGFAPAKRSLTETIEVDLPQIIKSVPVVDLPQEINLKKQMFIQ